MAAGFKDIVFEPDGNIPPDFSIEGKIAVEVRRLNQNFFAGDEVSGLEEDRIPLFKLLEESLKKFNSQYIGNSYWISIRFGRPIPNREDEVQGPRRRTRLHHRRSAWHLVTMLSLWRQESSHHGTGSEEAWLPLVEMYRLWRIPRPRPCWIRADRGPGAWPRDTGRSCREISPSRTARCVDTSDARVASPHPPVII